MSYTPATMSPRRRPTATDHPGRVPAFVREKAELEGQGPRQIRDILAAHGLSPRKRFGQNFLIRPDLAERIVDHAHVHEDDIVVEIGPGTGALTARLEIGRAHV